jgi:hypothetical protein
MPVADGLVSKMQERLEVAIQAMLLSCTMLYCRAHAHMTSGPACSSGSILLSTPTNHKLRWCLLSLAAPAQFLHAHADIVNTQLRSREVDLAEAQHTASAAQAEAAALRSQLAAAQQAAAADAAAMETRLAAKEAEVRYLEGLHQCAHLQASFRAMWAVWLPLTAVCADCSLLLCCMSVCAWCSCQPPKPSCWRCLQRQMT